MVRELNVVGKRVLLKDAIRKVTGKEIFSDDLELPGMLYAKILRSPYPHARIRSIDTSKAEALPGVKAVITYKDSPPTHILCAIHNWEGPVLDKIVRFVGDEVAAVAAVDEETAEEALDLIEVDYEILPAVVDVEEAMKPGAPTVHEIGYVNNVRNWEAFPGAFPMFGPVAKRGDVEKGFAEADLIVEHEVRTPSLHPGQMELGTCVAWWNDDKLTLWISHQCPFEIRGVIAKVLGMPECKVRIIAPTVGGAFGFHNSSSRFLFISALLAKKAGRPVKYRFTREELLIHKRRDSTIQRLKIGLKRDGAFTALVQEHIFDNGAYGFKIHPYCNSWDMYRIPNFDERFYGVATNKISSGCIRGVGNFTTTLGREQIVDMALEKLGLDPLEFRMKNHIRATDVPPPTTSEAWDDCIRKGAEAIGWKEKWKGFGKPYEVKGSKRRAVGMAVSMHLSGITALPVSAVVIIDRDGKARLLLGFQDLGTNMTTTMAQIVAEALGFRLEDVVVEDRDTDYLPYAPMTGASITAYIGGSVAKVAALDAKRKLLDYAAKLLKVKPEELDIKDSRVYVKERPEVGMKVEEVTSSPLAPIIIGAAPFHDLPITPPAITCIAAFADVEVDVETGEVKILKLVQVNDMGQPINPEVCENQMGGGMHMSAGAALLEELVHDPNDGRVLNPSLLDYKEMTALDFPTPVTLIAENIDPAGPFGAKGLGEAPANCAHAAIAAAIYNAIGVRINEFPITPDKILKALGRV